MTTWECEVSIVQTVYTRSVSFTVNTKVKLTKNDYKLSAFSNCRILIKNCISNNY